MRCVGGFDVGKTAVQVHGGGRFGQARVSGGYCLGNGGVFGGGCGEAGGVVGGKPPDAHQVHAQAAHGLRQVGIGDGSVDGFVQPAHELVVVVAGGIRAADQ